MTTPTAPVDTYWTQARRAAIWQEVLDAKPDSQDPSVRIVRAYKLYLKVERKMPDGRFHIAAGTVKYSRGLRTRTVTIRARCFLCSTTENPSAELVAKETAEAMPFAEPPGNA